MKEKDNAIGINIKVFIKILLEEKIGFILIFVSTIVIGLIFSVTLREEFISEGKILPEIQSNDGKLGNIKGLASLAGLDVANFEGTDAIRPDLFPEILKSTPFFLQLFKITINTQNNKSLTFEEFFFKYIEDKKEIEIDERLLFPVKDEKIIILNKRNEKRIEELKARIKSNIDKKNGIISITAKMPDPVVAAKVARFAMDYLTFYVSNYRVQKEKKDLLFLEERLISAKGNFYNNQERKARYSDQYQFPTIKLQMSDLNRERIESDYKISASFYNELLKKYEEAKIKVQQETPVFQILEPPLAPTEKSEPRRIRILFIFGLLGLFLGVVYILVKNKNYKMVFIKL